jgi:hypothetical protein
MTNEEKIQILESQVAGLLKIVSKSKITLTNNVDENETVQISFLDNEFKIEKVTKSETRELLINQNGL